jgi:hypothetical protein
VSRHRPLQHFNNTTEFQQAVYLGNPRSCMLCVSEPVIGAALERSKVEAAAKSLSLEFVILERDQPDCGRGASMTAAIASSLRSRDVP